MRRCTAGQDSEALKTTVLPQARAIAMARTPRMTGAFHGAMPTQTPMRLANGHGEIVWNVAGDDFAGDLRGHRGGFAKNLTRRKPH